MLAQICQLSRAAGATIMAVYDSEQPLNIEQKRPFTDYHGRFSSTSHHKMRPSSVDARGAFAV